MRPSLTSSHFVGRVGELAELEQARREADGGQPVVVMVGGDSGVGKTRLVSEFLSRHDSGALVLQGSASLQADGELPYAPLLSALRPLVRRRHPALSALGRASRSALAALLPDLEDGEPAPERNDPSAQLRLFDALLDLLDLCSEEHGLVMILEDMHWADRSTRAFVSFLARTLREERVMVLLTYRADELHRRHALRPLLAELERLDLVRRIDLTPFDRAELAEALADILGDEPSPQLVERVFARSEGNPLYTEELLAAGLDGRGAAPRSLRDAFLLRIERLGPETQRAVRAIAVGRMLDEATISELIDADHESLHGALREAVDEQVLIACEEARLGFRHALLREAVYDDLLPGERGELHLALAQLYEDRMEGQIELEPATMIASHYAAAGDQPAALRATVQAALAAREVHAHGETADLAERALELWPRVPEASTMLPLDHVELLTLAAEAHAVGGDRARGEVLLRHALEELDPKLDARRYSALLAKLARTEWQLNRGLEGVETAQRALSMLPDDEVSPERVALVAWLARTRFLRGRFRDAIEDAEEALAEAVAIGDRRAQGEVLNTLGMARIALGHVDQGVEDLRGAVAIAKEHEDDDAISNAYSNLASVLSHGGRTLEALAIAQEGLAATPRRATRSRDWMTLSLADVEFDSGDWRAAREHVRSVSAHIVGTALLFRQIRSAELALGEGDLEAATRCLEALEEHVIGTSQPQWIGAFGTLMGELLRRQHDLIAARTALAQALDRLEVCTDDVMQIASISAVGLRVEADIAQRARDLREKADERDALSRARIHMQRVRAAAQEGGPVARAWREMGAAELARARGKDDPRLWLKAAEAWAALTRPYYAAIARWRAAQAYVEGGERAEAAEVAALALTTARELGSRWLVDELTGLAERARLDLDRGAAADHPPASDDEDSDDPFGLTARERQVLALLAEGATNRQIGNALFMAEKTASVHVSRILSKLGVRSRTQAAAVAHRLHLSR
jgi:DNA-binding CsgD family transcriptional regulator/predicted negative regulator of RcsB-dependent stress response